jgi:HEAT repeats
MTTTATPPPPDVAAPGQEDLYGEMEALCQLVRLGQGRFTLALVEYDLPRAHTEVIAYLREQFSALNRVEAALSPPPPDAPLTYNVLDQLKNVAQAISPDKPPDVLICTGLETLFPQTLSTDDGQMSDELRRALQPLNLGRNLLAEMFPCPVLLFLPKAAMEIVLTSAPDIVSWKAGFFVFESDLQKVRAELVREADVKVNISWLARWRLRRLTFDELSSEARRLKALIADARALPAEPLIVARLHNRLGWTALALGDGSEADKSFAEMLRLARCENDAKLIKTAERGLRQADKLQSKRPRSLKHTVDRKQSFHGAAALSQADGLFGRETELQELLLQVTRVGNRFVTVWGETGCGKTSLVLAGVVPEVEKHAYLSVVVREWQHPASALRSAIEKACDLSLSASGSLKDWLQAAAQKTEKTIIVVCDQFEQFFTRHPNRQEREPLLKEIGACLNNFRLPCKFIFILREDYLGRMVELEKYVGDALDKNRRFYLSLFDQATALRVMRQLAGKAGLNWPDVFLSEVIKDLTEDGQVRPIELQLVGAALETLDINDEQAYSRAGRAEGLLTDYLQATLESVSKTRRELQDLKRVLLALIEEPHERLSLTTKEIAVRSKVALSRVHDELKKLIGMNLVRGYTRLEADQAQDESTNVLYELMHDVLVDSVLRLTRDLQDNHRLARKILTRALEDVRVKPRHTISLRQQRLLRNYLPVETKNDPKVRALLNRSLLWGMTKWVTLLGLIPLAILIFIQSTFTHITIEQDFSDRLVIRRGLPQLGFLPLIGNKILIDTGYSRENLAREKRSTVQGIISWELDNRRGGAIDEKKFYESFDSLVEQGQFLRKIGHKDEGLAKFLDALKKDKDGDVRREAATAFAAVFKADASLARPAFEPLLATLKEDKDDDVRRAATTALVTAIEADKSLARSAFEPLLTILKEDKENSVRAAAATVLVAAIEADQSLAKSALEPLLTALKNEPLYYEDAPPAAKVLVAAIEADKSLARSAFEPLLTILKDNHSNLHNPAAKVLAATITADKSLARSAFEPLLTILKEVKENNVRPAAVTGLVAAIEADQSLAKPAIEPLLTTLKEDKNRFNRVAAETGLMAAIEADKSLAKSALEPLLIHLKETNDRSDPYSLFRPNPVSTTAAQALAVAFKADKSLARSAFGALLTALKEDKDSHVRDATVSALMAAIEADKSLARPAFEPLLTVLKEDKYSDVRSSAARVLTAIFKADASLARPAIEPLLTVLKEDKYKDVRAAAVTGLVAAIEADQSLAKSAFEPLLTTPKEDKDRRVRSAVADALTICIISDDEVRNRASQLFADYDDYIRRGVIEGFARHLAILAKEKAASGGDPVQFLFDHLEGKQSLMPNGNAITYAVYRQVVVGAMTKWLVSKQPEAVATQDKLRERLETMRDQETRLYLRIAAWDTLTAATNLRNRQNVDDFEDIDE